MASKITSKQAKGLFEIQATVGRSGCWAARPVVTEELDPVSIVDIVHSPDTLSSALDRINQGMMTYEEFQTLQGGGDYDYDSHDDIDDDFDEEEYYVDKERDSVDRRGKYYDRDKESRLLAAESKNESQSDSISHKESKSPEVDREPDKSDKGDDKVKGGDENE